MCAPDGCKGAPLSSNKLRQCLLRSPFSSLSYSKSTLQILKRRSYTQLLYTHAMFLGRYAGQWEREALWRQ